MQASSRFPLKHVYQDTHLVIPSYQRSYEWEPSHVTDLLSDIETIRTKQKKYDRNADHLFGTVVLVSDGETNINRHSTWERFEVVDGQQRLTTTSMIARCLATELKQIHQHLSETALEQLDPDPETTADELIDTFVESQGHPHIDPETRVDEAYSELILRNNSPATVLNNPDYQASLFERRLANAKQTILDWITDQRDRNNFSNFEDATDTQLTNHYTYLQDVFGILANKFRVLVDVSESTGQSARDFRNLNTRGKGASVSSQIKSHLMTIANENPEMDSTNIATRFNATIERVSQHPECTEKDIENFITTHWRLFTGETPADARDGTGLTTIEDRVMKHSKHGALIRPPEELRAWAHAYVDTLETAVEWYYHLLFPEKFRERYDGEVASELGQRMNGVLSGQKAFSNTIIAILIPILEAEGPNSREALNVVSQCESYNVRYHQIMKRGQTTLTRNYLGTRAQRLTWMNYDGDLHTVFNIESGSNLTAYSSVNAAVSDITEYMQEKIDSKCDDEAVAEYLREHDLVTGEFRNQWGGARSIGLKYVLYEYERQLRGGSSSALQQMPTFTEIKQNYEIEHIAPENPQESDRLPRHKHYKNRLGNLGLLMARDNKNASNKSYSEKYHSVYQDTMFKHITELPSAEDGWDADSIESRTDSLVSFVMRRWPSNGVYSPQPNTSTTQRGTAAPDGGW